MALLKWARDHAENGEFEERVEFIRSDLKYPWPTGKAPWSLERGGDGRPPPGVRLRHGSTTAEGQTKYPLVDLDDAGPLNEFTAPQFVDYGLGVAEKLATAAQKEKEGFSPRAAELAASLFEKMKEYAELAKKNRERKENMKDMRLKQEQKNTL